MADKVTPKKETTTEKASRLSGEVEALTAKVSELENALTESQSKSAELESGLEKERDAHHALKASMAAEKINAAAQISKPIPHGVVFSKDGHTDVVVLNSDHGGAEEQNGQYVVRVNHAFIPFRNIAGEREKDRANRLKAYEARLCEREKSIAQEVMDRMREIGAPEYKVSAEDISHIR